LSQQRYIGEVYDSRSGGNQYIRYRISKAKWKESKEQAGCPPYWSRKETEKLLSDTKATRDQAVDALQSAREASRINIVSVLSEAYENEANALSESARTWLGITGGFAAGTVGLLVYYIGTSTNDLSTGYAIFRAVTLGILVAAAGLCLRVHNAYKSLELLNRHRVNLGRTFEQLKNSQPTEKAKEIVAAMVSEELVFFGKSAFAGKDADKSLNVSAEVIKSLLEKVPQ